VKQFDHQSAIYYIANQISVNLSKKPLPSTIYWTKILEFHANHSGFGPLFRALDRKVELDYDHIVEEVKRGKNSNNLKMVEGKIAVLEERLKILEKRFNKSPKSDSEYDDSDDSLD